MEEPQSPDSPRPRGHLTPELVPPRFTLRHALLWFVLLVVVPGLIRIVVFTACRAYFKWYGSRAAAQVVGSREQPTAPAYDPHDVCAAHYVALQRLFRKRQHVFAADHDHLLLEGGLVAKVTGAYFTRAGKADLDSLTHAALLGHDVTLRLPELPTFRRLYTPETVSASFPGEPTPPPVAGAHYGVIPVIVDLAAR